MNPLSFITRPDPKPWPGVIPTEPAEPYKYRNPYPPPAGRRVRDADGTVWTIQPDGRLTTASEHGEGSTSWGTLLAGGPVELVELTDDERASEPVYGPVGARWGKPGTPCAYEGCALDQGHVGGHYDQAGNPIDFTDHADQMYVPPPRGMMLRRICTCGNHAQHQPGCARYVAPLNRSEAGPADLTDEQKQMVSDLALVVPDVSHDAHVAAVTGQEHPELVPLPRKRTPRKVAGAGPAPTGRKRGPRKAQP